MKRKKQPPFRPEFGPITYDMRKLRRKIFRHMIVRDKKRPLALLIPHRIVYFMEEQNMTEIEVRAKFQWFNWDYDRQIVKLYFLRRRFAVEHEQMGLKEWGGPIW